MIAFSVRSISKQLLRSRAKQASLQRPSSFDATTWVYRERPPLAPKWHYWYADIVSATMWWWMFVHAYYQFGHLVGEYEYPIPSKWTDEELGVVSEV